MDSRHGREKEIGPAFAGDEPLQSRNIFVHRLAWQSEILFCPRCRVFANADNGIGVIIQLFELWVIGPGILNEFVLTGDIGIEARKEQAYFSFRREMRWGSCVRISVQSRPADDPMPAAQSQGFRGAIVFEAIPGI